MSIFIFAMLCQRGYEDEPGGATYETVQGILQTIQYHYNTPSQTGRAEGKRNYTLWMALKQDK